ncbi:MAG: GtrA family protein [Clostridiales bacterium]|nr:GtrA family protein [Clostridiales bacterium]
MNFKDLFKKYKDVIPYIIFGVLTTVVNIAVYWLMAHPLEISVMPSTIIAWMAAVLFAYLTNRKWVFRSEANTAKAITKEVLSFFLCRLATGAVDCACMFVFVDILHLNDVVIKFMANILVVILNYVASKLFIFKRKKGN